MLQAMENDRLFILDYHDLLLPFVKKINSLKGRKVYASRTIFFRTRFGTLRPIAIELSLPPTASNPPKKKGIYKRTWCYKSLDLEIGKSSCLFSWCWGPSTSEPLVRGFRSIPSFAQVQRQAIYDPMPHTWTFEFNIWMQINTFSSCILREML